MQTGTETPLWQLDACALCAQLAAGQVTPMQLLDHFLARIAALNPSLNAVVCLAVDAADEARQSAERLAAGRPKSRIDGLPVLLKDNLRARNMPATWGSRLYADRVVADDELPVAALRDAGAVIVGKTNLPEFAVEGFTGNALFGVTANPWDLSLTPGGSSGGSVAAVAAGLIPAAIGTDGGGSIRRPAAYTGLVGLKPSLGRIPRGNGLPQLLLDMEVVGPLTRSVRDQALLFDVMARPDSRDHRSLRFPAGSATTALATPLPTLHILAVERFADAPLDPHIQASFRHTVERLSVLGHRVERGELPLDIGPLNDGWTSIGHIGLGRLLRQEPQMRRLASSRYVDWGDTHYDTAHLLQMIDSVATLRDRAAQLFDTLDVIVTPSCAAMPWPTAEPFPLTIDGQAVGPRGSAVYTGWVNACGHPALSVPAQRGRGELPIGVQLVGGLGRDEALLQLAQQLETQQSWLDRWPGLAYRPAP